MKTRATALVVGACLWVATTAAQGQTSESSKAAAVALYDQAQQLISSGDYAAACPKLAESNRLDPQLGALLHLADCYEKVGRLASAWASWRDAAEIAQKRGDAREQTAKDRAAALAPKLSKLVVEVPTASDLPALELRRDDVIVPRALWGAEIPVDVGEHVFVASAPGKKKLTAKVVIAQDGAREVFKLDPLEDEPVPASAAPPAAPPPASPLPPPIPQADTPHSNGTTQRTLGWISGGLGVVGLGVGVFFDLRRSSSDRDRNDICPSGKNCTQDDKDRVDSLNDDVKSAGIAEMVSFGVGGALVATGVVLVLTAPSSRAEEPRQGWLLTPGFGTSSAGLLATRRW